MAVVGVQLHAAHRAGVLKAAVRRRKLRERLCHGLGRCTHFHAGSHCRQRVHDVEGARYAQRDVRHAVSLKGEVKLGAAGFIVCQVGGPPLAILAHAVGDHFAMLAGKQVAHTGVVAISDAHAVRGEQLAEAREGVADVGKIPVVIQMVFLYVGDDRDGRVELQKAGVKLAGFHDECLVPCPRACAADVIELAAMCTVGSSPVSTSTSAIIEVVVVLPCVPHTLIAWR